MAKQKPLIKGARKEKPFCGGTWTTSKFFGFIRSNLRKMSMKWGPRNEAKDRRRRNYTGPNKRQRFEYQCDGCGGWFKGTEVEVDHKVPCGSLTCWEDLAPFVQRLLCEADGFQVLCKAKCHHRKTHKKKKS